MNTEAIRPPNLCDFYTKNDKSWGCHKTKRLGVGPVNCGTRIRRYGGGLNERLGLLSQVAQIHLARTRVFWSSWSREDTLLMGNLMTCFMVEKEGQTALPAPADSQMPSTQNNQYANSTYFGGSVYTHCQFIAAPSSGGRGGERHSSGALAYFGSRNCPPGVGWQSIQGSRTALREIVLIAGEV